jgi:hypothetical protein
MRNAVCTKRHTARKAIPHTRFLFLSLRTLAARKSTMPMKGTAMSVLMNRLRPRSMNGTGENAPALMHFAAYRAARVRMSASTQTSMPWMPQLLSGR